MTRENSLRKFLAWLFDKVVEAFLTLVIASTLIIAIWNLSLWLTALCNNYGR